MPSGSVSLFTAYKIADGCDFPVVMMQKIRILNNRKDKLYRYTLSKTEHPAAMLGSHSSLAYYKASRRKYVMRTRSTHVMRIRKLY